MSPTSPYFDIRRDTTGQEVLEAYVDGMALLRLVLTNKGTAFTPAERAALGLEGLLPPAVRTLEQQVEQAWASLQGAPTPLDLYQALRGLQERQEVLFYAVLVRHLRELLPIVYTPTVGDAVKEFSARYQHPRGLTFSPLNVARAHEACANYPLNDVRMIVATDSSAILGIGDQGYGGLAIPIGKLALYTAAGGVSPFHTLPVALDVGSDRADLLEDPMYLGVRQPRLRGQPYLDFLDRVVEAVRRRWPGAVLQWEDLSKETAFTVLERYRRVLPSFNDDIQGTGAVTLAGVRSACHLKGEALADQRIVIHGAGAGGIGVAWALKQGLLREGLSEAEALARLYVLDSRGLLTADRALEAYKRGYAQPRERIAPWAPAGTTPDLLQTVRGCGATVLLGLSGQPGAFTGPVVRALASTCARPIIFPLSNPTTSAEATPADILAWTGGRAIVAAGSPFSPVAQDGQVHTIGQGNNAFIFPGLGAGAIACRAREVTDGMVLAAADALTTYTLARDVPHGRVYPDVSEIQEVAVHVAAAVIRRAQEEGVATRPMPEDVEAHVRREFWHPHYLPVVRGSREEGRAVPASSAA